MQIFYNFTGAKRKELVSAVSQELNAPVKYLGMPSASYQVGGYIIDKGGTLKGEDNSGLVADLQGLHDFIAISAEYDEPMVLGSPELFEELQMDRNEELGLGRTRHEECQGENGMQESDVLDIDQHHPGQYTNPHVPMCEKMGRQVEDYYTNNLPYEEEPNRLTIEMPLAGFTQGKIDNLSKLVIAKAQLIKAALGTDDLPIQQTEDTLKFLWFNGDCTSDEVKAYTHFVTALCEMAKKLNRVTTTERLVDNELYAFRCFLLRLGFIGSEYKTERKILLSKLTGSSSSKQ